MTKERTNVYSASPEYKEKIAKELDRIKKEWNALFPKMKLTKLDIAKAIGRDQKFIYSGYPEDNKNKALIMDLKTLTLKDIIEKLMPKLKEIIANK